MAVIGSLSVKLGLVTVEWDKATAQAKKQAKDLQAAFNNLGVDLKGLQNIFQQIGGAAGLTVAGFGAMAHSVLELSGNLQDLSKTYDVSIAKVLQFQDAMIQAGGKSEDAGKVIATVFTKVAEAQQGNEAAIASFEELNISFEQLRSMSPEETLNAVYKGLSAIGNTYDRIKLTKEILGKGGLHKSVQEISEALGESTAEFQKQEEAMKAWAQLGDRIDKTVLNLKLAFAEFFKVLAGGDFVPSINQFKSAMVAVTAVATINGMLQLVTVFKALNVALKSTASLSAAIQAGSGIKGIAMAGVALAAYFGAMKAYESGDEPDAEGSGSGQEGGGTPTATQTGDRREISAGRVKINLIKQLMGFENMRAAAQLKYLQGSQHELQLTESAIKAEEEIAVARNERAQALKKENLSAAQRGLIDDEFTAKRNKAYNDQTNRDNLINAQRKLAIKLYEQETVMMQEKNLLDEKGLLAANEQYKMNQWQIAMLNEQLALEKKLLDLEQQRKIAKETYTAGSPEMADANARIDQQIQNEQKLSNIRQTGIAQDQARAKSFSAGWEDAFRKFSEDAGNYGKVGGDMFNSVTGNMNAALDNFVRTGKLSFSSLAKSIIQDLIAIQLKSSAMSMFKSGISLFATGGTDVGGYSSAAAEFANGGSPSINEPAIVGERGPELFIPKTAGTIIPNGRMASAMGGSQTVNNFTINAIDTKSFEERLYSSSNAVWAANQYANKSLAIGRGRS